MRSRSTSPILQPQRPDNPALWTPASGTGLDLAGIRRYPVRGGWPRAGNTDLTGEASRLSGSHTDGPLMSPNLRSRWTTWGTVSSGFREIELRWDRLGYVGLLAPFLAPAIAIGHERSRHVQVAAYPEVIDLRTRAH